MFSFLFCVLLVALAGVCGGVYLYFPARVTFPQARAQCQRYNMTLLELRSQAELDRWNSLKHHLFRLARSLGAGGEEPWLGLVHDGSRYGDKGNYHWLDAGRVTFLTWPGGDGEPNGLPREACVRVRFDRFGTKACNHLGYSTVCQKPEFSGQKMKMEIFRRIYYRRTSGRTSSLYSVMDLQDLEPRMWLVARPDVTSAANNVISCLLLCKDSQNCVARFQPAKGCSIMDLARLTAIHGP